MMDEDVGHDTILLVERKTAAAIPHLPRVITRSALPEIRQVFQLDFDNSSPTSMRYVHEFQNNAKVEIAMSSSLLAV